MTEKQTAQKPAKVFNLMLILVGSMCLLGFWYGFYLTYRMLSQCTGIKCMNVVLPALVSLFSLILFLTLIRAVTLVKKSSENKKADLLMAFSGFFVIMVPVFFIWLTR